MSVEQVRIACVDAFPASTVRADIFAGFLLIYETYVDLEITGDLWIDGSFLTQKIDPGDIDFIAWVPRGYRENGTEDQRKFLEWMIAKEDEPRAVFKCHTEIVEVVAFDHPDYRLYIAMRDHFENQVYGFSVAHRTPKGIAVISLPVPAEREAAPEPSKNEKIDSEEVGQ